MGLFAINEFKGIFQNLLDYLKKNGSDALKTINLTNLGIHAGPELIFSFGLPLIGLLIYKKKQNSPTARKIANFLGINTLEITEKDVFKKISSNPTYYAEIHHGVIEAMLNQNIGPLKDTLHLTDEESWEIYRNLNDIVFSKETLTNLYEIIPSLKDLKIDIESIKMLMMEFLKSPAVKISDDPNKIIEELNLREYTQHVPRKEDAELSKGLDMSKIIIITGGPGSGKSESVANLLTHCKEKGFTTFLFIKNYFSEGDQKNLDFLLSNKDHLVITWDNIHEQESKFVIDVIRRICDICKCKTFKMICTTRKAISISEAYNVNLETFDNEKLIVECSKLFNVKMSVSNDAILKIGDGTPYYIISLFEIHKDGEISAEVLADAPSTVINQWYEYIEENIRDKKMDDSQISAFRSIGLLSYASTSPEIPYERIVQVFSKVFGEPVGKLTPALKKLVENSFVSSSNNRYHTHDSHIEALEKYFSEDNDYVIGEFLKIEENIENLAAFGNRIIGQENYKLLEMISSRIIEFDPLNSVWLFQKGRAIFNLKRIDEAIQYYDKVINLGKVNYYIGLSYWGKAVIYLEDFDLLKTKIPEHDSYEKSLEFLDMALHFIPMYKEELILGKGTVLTYLKNYEGTIKYYDEVIGINSSNYDAWNDKGVALMKLERFDEAIKCFNKIIETNPENPSAWYNRSCAKVQNKDVENGLSDLKTAIQINKEEYIKLAENDEDFNTIRNDSRFQSLIQK